MNPVAIALIGLGLVWAGALIVIWGINRAPVRRSWLRLGLLLIIVGGIMAMSVIVFTEKA